MRLLILLRHGKSDWQRDSGIDHERPLAPRGVKAARRMGDFLSRAGMAPDALLSSTAIRARTTAELAAEGGDWSSPVQLTRRLYASDLAGTLGVVREVGGDIETLMLVGHQPTWSQVASALIGGGHVGVVTAAAVGIDLAVQSWRDIDAGCGSLRFLVPPRMLD